MIQKNRRKKILLFLFLLLIGSVALFQYWRVKDMLYTQLYDLRHQQAYVSTPKEMNEILSQFEKVPYRKLAPDYLSDTKSNVAPFKKMLQNKKYYRVPGSGVYRFIVGHIRIKDLMPKDARYKSSIGKSGEAHTLNWLIDPKVLKAFISLKDFMDENGYDFKALSVYNGFRHPAYNEAVGGASVSRHILGQAIDISVGDINGDGKADKVDKDIILEVLDKKIIGNRGGLGRYPGTQSVHFDVRGKRARWDRQ